jgi:hypothetical protein
VFIVFGTKGVATRMGRVADYCPMCRGIAAFEVLRVGEKSHLYGVPMGSETVLGYNRACETCGEAFGADLGSYLAVSENWRASIQELIEGTNPGVEALAAERSALDARLASGQATREERLTRIFEALALMEPRVAPRVGGTTFDFPSSAGCGGTIVLGLAALTLRSVFESSAMPAIVAAILAGAALVFTIGALLTDAKRFARRNAMPQIAGSLRSLRPTLDELTLVRQAGLENGLAIARYLDPAELLALIEQEPAMGAPSIRPRGRV